MGNVNQDLVKCPFCKQEVANGKFCSNCSRPLNPKWYQKNSLSTIAIMIVAILFLVFCVYASIYIGL